MDVFCNEYNLPREVVMNSKPKNKRETELRVVAEFINMYLERLHNNIEGKIRSLERLKNIIEHGKKPAETITDILLKHINFSDKTEKKKFLQGSPLKNPTKINEKTPAGKKKSRSVSPEDKNKLAFKKKSQEKIIKAKTNVGKNAKRYSSGKLSSIPEERKKSPVGISRKNPLDSITSLNESVDDLDDIIYDLNPSKKPEGSKNNLSATNIKTTGNKPKDDLRKPEFDSSEGLFKFKLTKSIERKEVFASIDAPLMQSKERLPFESVYKSISDIENVRFPKKPPETRSELITSGIKPFHPYMDKDGNIFNPSERFPNVKADDVDPFDPYFLEEIGNLSPNPDTDWYLRSHHLRSFTNHPLSVNDNPNFYKAQMQVGLKEENTSNQIDQRDVAIAHLEKTLEDLKCELEYRKRTTAVNTFSNEGRLSGFIEKAITPISQGLNTNEKEGLVLHTYESILDELRTREKNILNQKRTEAYEVNRPPQGKWFELKSSEFTKEMQRHLSSLKPKEEQRKLLNNLAIPDLY